MVSKYYKSDLFPTSLIVLLVISVSSLVRWLVATHPHSGESKPPMYGDYEAQRHWMEITYNLPVQQWYRNTSDNDLLYWGLDYPPLTAYHSWIMGYVANQVNSSWVELYKSRGEQSYKHKYFMRWTVFVADVLIFYSAVVFHILKCVKLNVSKANVLKGCAIFSILMYPGFLLIDYGHFQSINLLLICATVLCTFALIWWPFLTLQDTLQVLRRIFPVGRGVFEDKVANVWCASSVIIKWKIWFPQQIMTYLSAICTLLMCLPSCCMLLLRPTVSHFQYALINCSLAFFLFSFQVHEKTILLVAMPILLMLHEEALACSWFLIISVISLYPLMVKDYLWLAFYTLTLFYYVWLSDVHQLKQFKIQKGKSFQWNFKVILYHCCSVVGVMICIASSLLPSPARYPDIWTMLNCIYSCAHFCLFMVYFNYKQFCCYQHSGIKVKKL